MYYTIIASFIALALRCVNSQDLSSIPDCAKAAASSGITQTGCGISDIKCICSASEFLTSLSASVMGNCSETDQLATVAFAELFCGNVGVVPPSTLPTVTASGGDVTSTSVLEAAPSSVEDVFSSTAVAASSVLTSHATDVSSDSVLIASFADASSSMYSAYFSVYGATSSSFISDSATSTGSASTAVYSTSSAVVSITQSLDSIYPSAVQTSFLSSTSVLSPFKAPSSNITVATNQPIPFKGGATTSFGRLSWMVACAAAAVAGRAAL